MKQLIAFRDYLRYGDSSPVITISDNRRMELSDLHDGYFDGIWLAASDRAHLFLRTLSGSCSTLVLTGVAAANVTNLRTGNIIFDAVIVPTERLTSADVIEAHQLQSTDSQVAEKALRKAQEMNLSALQISSSYGAECSFLFRSSQMLPNHVLAEPLPTN
jgi:hypothetical protein